MIRNLIWDMDGTLFDTYPAINQAFALACADLGKPPPVSHIAPLTKKSRGHCTAVLATELSVDPDEVARHFTQDYGAVGPEQQPPFPGVQEVCAYIQHLGGKNIIVTHRQRESTERFLAVHRLANYFADVVGAEDGYASKPDAAAFTAMLRKHSLVPDETLGVGDRDIDILAAQAAGIRACLFGVEDVGVVPDLAVADFGELLRFLKVACPQS